MPKVAGCFDWSLRASSGQKQRIMPSGARPGPQDARDRPWDAMNVQYDGGRKSDNDGKAPSCPLAVSSVAAEIEFDALLIVILSPL